MSRNGRERRGTAGNPSREKIHIVSAGSKIEYCARRNAGCLYDEAAQVPLNQFERYNVRAIKKAEAKKGC
jgi:hypothetical protein